MSGNEFYSPPSGKYVSLVKQVYVQAADPGLNVSTFMRRTDLLTRILLYHVVSGRVLASDVVQLSGIDTLNGRVSVTVNDGMNETSATSGVFRSLGAPPTVRILGPAKGTRVRADAVVVAEGSAYDDAGRKLAGAGASHPPGRVGSPWPPMCI